MYLGKEFISVASNAAQLKDEMTSKIKGKYLMRAAMSGIVLGLGYLLYFALSANFEEAGLAAIGKVLGGSMFSFVLITIYYTKSELLTSNMMITTVGKYNKIIDWSSMFKIMFFCYIGNALGGLLIAVIVVFSSIITPEMLVVMEHSIHVKQAYIEEAAYVDLLMRSILCNFAINLAMLMVYAGNMKSDFAKMAAMFFGVFMFMYLGFEHSVANTVLFTIGGLYDMVHGTDMVHAAYAIPNVIIALIGNFIGGGILIGLYYSFMNDDSKNV